MPLEKVLVHKDHGGLEIRKYSEEKLSTAPTTDLFEGRKYFNTTDKKLYVYNGTSWKEAGDSSSLKSIAAGSSKISIDNTDPLNPEIDVTVSNLIDDTQSTSSNIYSAQKVDSEISNAVNGLSALAYKDTIDSSLLIDDGVVGEFKLSTAVQIKLNANASQNNSTATTNPTVNDDSSLGYSIKSLWLNQTTKEAFMCFDATVGAAVWVKQTLTVDELGALALKNTIDSDTLLENNVVSLNKIQQIGSKKLLGNISLTTDDVDEVPVSDLGLDIINAEDAAEVRGLINALSNSATTADIADSIDKRYVTDNDLSNLDNLDVLAFKNTIDSSSLINDGIVTPEKLDVEFKANFLSTDFVSGYLTILPSTHGLGSTGDLNVIVKDSSGKVINEIEKVTASDGTVTIGLEPGFGLEFNGRILINKLS